MDEVRLTKKQRTAANLYLQGMSKTEAYLAAGYASNQDRHVLSSMVARVFSAETVKTYIEDILENTERQIEKQCETEDAREVVLTRIGMLRRLELMAQEADKTKNLGVELQVLQEICRIMGFYRPERAEVSHVTFQIDFGSGY